MAIPIDHDEFAADVVAGTDFLRTYAATLRLRTHEVWSYYEPYAIKCKTAIDAVRASGVTVVRRATLGAFAEAVGNFKVVTLIAHARGPEIAPHDLIDCPKIAAHVPAICTALDVLWPAANDTGCDALARWLDRSLGPAEECATADLEDARAQAQRVSLYARRWRRRLIIEALCPDALAGGPAIEFSDGLMSIERVDDAVPEAIRILDLTVCDSVLLADYLRATRPGGAILANPRPTTPDFRLLLYREAVGLMNRHKLSYIEAVLRLRRSLARRT